MIPDLHPLDLEKVRNSEHFQSLKAHPGFQALVGAAQDSVLRLWNELLVIEPEKLPFTQGFIAGVNFVLEYADAAISESKLALERHRRNQEEAFASVLSAETAQRQSRYGTVGMGARISE